MNRLLQFSGVCGIVLIVFGMISGAVIQDDNQLWSKGHLTVGLLLILTFLLSGGFRDLRAQAFKRAAGYGLGVTLYSALFIGIVGVFNYFFFRYDPLHYDSTEQKVFTLAPQTKKVLDGLQQVVSVRAFYIGGEVDKKVDDLLSRMAKHSPKFKWQAIDPEKSPRLAEEYGISERGTLHFSSGSLQPLPEDPENQSLRAVKIAREITEQDVVNAILKLTRGGEKKVYYVFGHGEADLESSNAAGYIFLKEAIEGENLILEQLVLAGRESIPADAAALIVLAPRRSFLSSETELLLNYLRAGGRALFLHEPKTVDDVAKFVKPLGIEIGNDLILEQELRVAGGPTIGVQPVVYTYGAHSITEEFRQGIIFSTTSSVRKLEPLPENSVVTELAFSSKNSWAEKNLEMLYADKPQAALDQDDIKGPVPLAVAFEGVIPGVTNQISAEAVSADSQKASRVVVIGDVDFVSNNHIRQLFNRDFFLNSLNWVVGDGERISIRERTMRKSVKTLTQEQFQSVFHTCAVLLPELVLLVGLAVWWIRKAR